MKAFAARIQREASLYPRLIRGLRSGGRRALFLPSSGPVQASLLRAFVMADALQELGWATLALSPRLSLAQRRRILALFRPDVVVVQKSRHPLNDPSLLEGWPIVYDLDDADFANPALAARIEATCRAARGVIAGSRYVAEWCRARNDDVAVVWTGTPISEGARPPHAARAPIVTWAQSDPMRYLAEFSFLEDVLARARPRLPALRFRLYGWRGDGGAEALARLRALDIDVETIPPLPYARFLESLRETAVGLSPICAQSEFGRGKSFGKILGYLDAMTPVIASDAGDHALFFDETSGVVSDDPQVWADAIVRLLEAPSARDDMAARAFEALQARLSIDAAARAVDAFLRRVLDGRAAPSKGGGR